MKHKLRVMRPERGTPPPTHIVFTCERCVQSIAIERWLMQELLAGLPGIPNPGVILWSECKGA